MALLTIQQLFGVTVVETSTTVTIQKTDLLGLTPSADNTADSILAGIINTAHQQFEGNLTDRNGDSVYDSSGVAVTFDNHLYFTNTWLIFWGCLFPKGYLNSCFIYSQLSPYAN